jgi:hypothetical protein
MRYTFSTSDIAANRLEEIATFFNLLSIQFVRKYIQEPVRLNDKAAFRRINVPAKK